MTAGHAATTAHVERRGEERRGEESCPAHSLKTH